MMKLKVVNDYRKHVVLEADTIGKLKSRIMDNFSNFKVEERVLIPDGRDMHESTEIQIVSNCFDLLELEDRTILDDLDGLHDGDTLLIGWKGPFILKLLAPDAGTYVSYTPNPKRDILVDCYTTVGELKRKIGTATGEPVTEDNLPEILFKADDNKQLLCFGFYRFVKTIHAIKIYRNRNNKREFHEFDGLRPVFYDKDGKKPGVRYYDDEEEMRYQKYTDQDGREKLFPTELYRALPMMEEDERKEMIALMPELQALPPYMGPATPSSMCLSNPPYGSSYHYDYGSPYSPYHLSEPPLHYDSEAAMLPPGGLYGVTPMMDRFGMPMRHGPMAPRTGSYLEESSQRNPKGREIDWICPTCGNDNNSFQNVCNMCKCKTRRPGSWVL